MIIAPPMQLATSNPKKWDAEWEKLLAMAYADPDFGPGKKTPSKHTELEMIRILREGLCALQAQLTRETLQYFVRGRFEEKWIAATPEERGKHVLAALCDVCTSAMNLHQSREFCAVELNVAAHQKDGKLLVGYIKEMMVENPAANPEDPVFISHPVWDALEHGASVHEKIALRFILVLRNKLIGNKHATNKKSALATDQPTKVTQPLVEGLGRAGAERHVKLEREALKGLYSERKQHCFHCVKPNNTKTRYSRCKGCWDNMQRETLYCSIACQKADWKNGHKTTCGRPLELEDIGPSAPERRGALKPPLIGAPLAGFKRSIQLMYQYPIYLLFIYKPVQVAVLAARAKALASGDRSSVAKLAHMLILASQHGPRARSLGVTKELIVKQFTDEYEFDEIERSLEEMRARMTRDPLHRPPLLIDAGFSAGAWKEYQDTWSKVGLAEIGVVPSLAADEVL
ncbi:hypothetical protein FB45DRAFT_1067487 [Roridomyces roridus]|uniref:MYND-type domain-containing protein n=1 Tax=Roridomyces roridus TaxID=1738132 RepID=A0AAD7B250_9AGAR|nr:hypothetical protein FB45DRAFT_1067487 [Roridomyces roridus]